MYNILWGKCGRCKADSQGWRLEDARMWWQGSCRSGPGSTLNSLGRACLMLKARSWLHFQIIGPKKKKKKLQPHKIFWKNQVKHPCSPDIQSLLSAIIRTFRNPMKTIILMRHYYLRALRQQWRLKGIMHCQNCVISTHSGPVWTSYCLQSSCPNCLPCWEWPSSSI